MRMVAPLTNVNDPLLTGVTKQQVLYRYLFISVKLSLVLFFEISYYYSPTTLWVEKQDTKLSPITSPNENRFS